MGVAARSVQGAADGFGAEAWLEFAGRLHPLVLHLPIGLFAGVVLLEGVAAVSPGARPARRALYVALGASAAAAAATGWLLGRSDDYGGALVDEHRVVGLAVGAAALVAMGVELLGRGRGGAALRVVALLACGGLLAAAGHRGGTITHGARFLSEAAPPWLAPYLGPVETGRDARGRGRDGTDLDGAAGPPAPGGPDGGEPPSPHRVDVAALVSVFRERCFECHSETKVKGDLRLDLVEGWIAGADATDVEWSELLVRVTLPADDVDAMPPDGPRVDLDTIGVLRAWIERGADGAEIEAALGL